jgi:hypothetical protein
METIREGVREVMITNAGATFVDVTAVFVESWVENSL